MCQVSISSEQITRQSYLQMQRQAVMAAIPTPATTSPVFSVTVTRLITQTTVRCQEHKFRTPESILSACTLSLHSKDVTIASRPSKLCSARWVYETLWFILDSLVLIFLPAMSLCCSGTNITYPRSRVVRPWGLEILYCVSDRSILVLNYALCTLWSQKLVPWVQMMREIVASHSRLLLYTGGNIIAWRMDGNRNKYTGRTMASPGKCGTHQCMGLSSLA